jgi:hypothetical protein
LLVLVTHNFIIGFISNGSAIALVICAFIMNLNMDYCMSRRLTFKGSTTWSNESFTFFNSQKCLFMTLRCKDKENFAYGCMQNWGYTMLKTFINFESTNSLFNYVTSISFGTSH